MINHVEYPGTEKINIAKTFGHLLRERFEKDPCFYLFSPDETTSNRLNEVYDIEKRAWALPIEDFDLPESEQGRIIELLSENALFACLVGHLSNGEQGMLVSYEAFLSIVLPQVIQQIKFYKQMNTVDWREPWPAVNLLSTSMCWRQDHNGYSHQSPAVISSLLSIPSGLVNCLFPVDDASAEAAFKFMLSSENVVNITTFDKNENPRWIDSYHANFLFDNGGASIYQFASDPDPEIILTAAGDIATREMLRAREIIKADYPEAKLRFVGINALTYGRIGTTIKQFEQSQFDDYFMQNLPIIASFHGYPKTLKDILGAYTDANRVEVHGYIEEGTTTTPMEMLSLNYNSRYDLASSIAAKLGRLDLVEKYQKIIAENHEYTRQYGVDKLSID